MVAARPDTFFLPMPSDMRYNWVRVWLDAIDVAEMRELVIDAWTIVVPKRVAAEYLRDHPSATTTGSCPRCPRGQRSPRPPDSRASPLPTRPTASALLTAEADGCQL